MKFLRIKNEMLRICTSWTEKGYKMLKPVYTFGKKATQAHFDSELSVFHAFPSGELCYFFGQKL